MNPSDFWQHESKDRTNADVLNPTHYSCYEIEPIDFIEANSIPYSEGNVIKYVCRWRMKDGIRDLIKAREYLDKLIERHEGQVLGTTIKAGER